MAIIKIVIFNFIGKFTNPIKIKTNILRNMEIENFILGE